MLFYVITIVIIIFIGIVCLVFANDENQSNVEFLENLGWQVDKNYTQKETIILPEVFDEVYNNYNSIQKLSGFDLSDYKGKKVTRYTYRVLNFPQDTKGKKVYINLLTFKDAPIGGDVLTYELDGFMYSLDYLNIGK